MLFAPPTTTEHLLLILLLYPPPRNEYCDPYKQLEHPPTIVAQSEYCIVLLIPPPIKLPLQVPVPPLDPPKTVFKDPPTITLALSEQLVVVPMLLLQPPPIKFSQYCIKFLHPPAITL